MCVGGGASVADIPLLVALGTGRERERVGKIQAEAETERRKERVCDGGREVCRVRD